MHLILNIYISIGSNLASKLPLPNVYIGLKSYIKDKYTNLLYHKPVKHNEIRNSIRNLINSSPHLDGITAYLIKNVTDDNATQLSYLFKLSLSCGVFSGEMKLVKVMPLYTNGDKIIIIIYKPVPLLSVFLERLMHNSIVDCVHIHDLLYKFQFGFHEKHCTSMALSVLDIQIISTVDKGRKCMGLFLDFSKAFDTSTHQILLYELCKYEIGGLHIHP